MIFEDTDPNGFPEIHVPIFGAGDSSSSSVPSPTTHKLLNLVSDNQPSERMQLGRQMTELGMAAVVAPIPGNIDEAIGTALLIAGVATMISEAFRN